MLLSFISGLPHLARRRPSAQVRDCVSPADREALRPGQQIHARMPHQAVVPLCAHLSHGDHRDLLPLHQAHKRLPYPADRAGMTRKIAAYRSMKGLHRLFLKYTYYCNFSVVLLPLLFNLQKAIAKVDPLPARQVPGQLHQLPRHGRRDGPGGGQGNLHRGRLLLRRLRGRGAGIRSLRWGRWSGVDSLGYLRTAAAGATATTTTFASTEKVNFHRTGKIKKLENFKNHSFFLNLF